ncbi:MAG: hypothetical protein JSU81_01135 [Candidatus Coatesbacteria bacterium]|nr:MAG: hypothetical protein JSU81_01135 [Candidatus Coatesbacteria bacterium]
MAEVIMGPARSGSYRQIVYTSREAVRIFNLLARHDNRYEAVGGFFSLYERPPADRPDLSVRADIPFYVDVYPRRTDFAYGLRFLEYCFNSLSSFPLSGNVRSAVERSFHGARTLAFEYYDVTEVAVRPVDFAFYAQGYRWRGEPAFLREALHEGRCSVILGSLEAAAFGVRGFEAGGAKIKPDLSFLMALFGLCLDVTVGTTDGYNVTFAGDRKTPVAVSALKVKLSERGDFDCLGCSAGDRAPVAAAVAERATSEYAGAFPPRESPARRTGENAGFAVEDFGGEVVVLSRKRGRRYA